jgi:hypothetical protein
MIRLANRDISTLGIQGEVASIDIRHAAICITDPNSPCYTFPPWVKPILNLSFNLFNTAYTYEKKDKVFRKNYVQQVKSRGLRFAEKSDAQKIITYCDAIARDKGKWILYVSCPDGYGRSTAITRWLKGLLRVPESSISYRFDTPYDRALTQLLNMEYSQLSKEMLTNEPDANSESTVRRKEDNPSV